MTTPEAVAAKLNGTLKKFTVNVLLKDGRSVEVQTDEEARVRFHDVARETFLTFSYSSEGTMLKISDLSGWVTTINSEATP